MKIHFTKYHALQNDFLVVESTKRLTGRTLPLLARKICHRRTGVGADGVLYLTGSKKADRKFIIYNSDGSWAEKSGNGLRIAGLHLHRKLKSKKEFSFETSNGIDSVTVVKKTKSDTQLMTSLGSPNFETRSVPVKSKKKVMINSELMINKLKFPVSCVSIGNPHTVLFVENFDFDWKSLGQEIEFHKSFPERTNVEFVRPVNRKKIRVADWERGAGATGSSGTGAAAAVVIAVTMGITDRRCEVQFENGSLFINWNADNNIIELTGPVEFITHGEYEY